VHLPSLIRTLGRDLRERHGARVHKIALDAGFTCPNRDGSRGTGGCTFCNNSSFSPNGRQPRPIAEQIAAGRAVIRRRTGARSYLAYFQAYTNTYADVASLKALYDAALAEPDVIGLSVGTRPDCVPAPVLDLLAGYRDTGREVWLELGLQSADDATLARVNRGHGFAEYREAALAARRRGLRLCTHLMVGLPGEAPEATLVTLQRVLDLGTDGLKLHPLHVVKGTALANDWRRGTYQALAFEDYVETAAALIEHTPPEIVYHRLTGTASAEILLAPAWCAQKWRVLNAIAAELVARGTCQGAALGRRLDRDAQGPRDHADRLAAADSAPPTAGPADGGGQPAVPGNSEGCRDTNVTAADLRFLRGPYAAGMPHTSLQGCIHGVSEQGRRVGR
jgi:radical SAM protein (TIGR01212 family)